jgi:L-2-hydroxyglutarate oxidase LhgO
MSERYDSIVIGAGIVGLAATKSITQKGFLALNLEASENFGTGISQYNSGVIHAGLYYPKGWLKSTTCIQGMNEIYALSEQFNISSLKCGKVIVADLKCRESELEFIKLQAESNGVEGLALITEKQLATREPEVKGVSALLSRNSGIVDVHELMHFYRSDARNNVGNLYDPLRTKARVTAIEQITGGWEITYKDRHGQALKEKSKTLVNAAGLHSDMVAEMSGLNVDQIGLRLHYCVGEYFRVSGLTNKVNGLVYPLPVAGGLGTHATIDFSGGVILGPNVVWRKDRKIIKNASESSLDEFFKAGKTLFPGLKKEWLTPDQAGVRPKLHGQGIKKLDFNIYEHGTSIHFGGIESPGVTASPILGKLAAEFVERNV